MLIASYFLSEIFDEKVVDSCFLVGHVQVHCSMLQVQLQAIGYSFCRSLLTFLDKVTWATNEFMSTNEKPRYKTKSYESSPIPR